MTIGLRDFGFGGAQAPMAGDIQGRRESTSQVTTPVTEIGAGEFSGAKSASNDRDALLRSLYADRGELVDLQALGRLEEPDRIRLADIDKEIARWEKQDIPVANSDEVWRQLEEMLGRTMALQARIESKKHASR